jgi:hypothetical protein
MHPGIHRGLAIGLVCSSFVLSACGPKKAAVTPVVASSAPAASKPPTIVLPVPVPTTRSTHATLRVVPAWRSCHEGFVVGTDAKSEAARLASVCAAATKMHSLGIAFSGEQTASQKPQTFPWKAQKGHCYRVYGVGAPSIKNLDLLLLDSNGAALAQDGTDDGAPIALDAGAVCWKDDDDARLVVSVGEGEGAFAVEIWGD